MTYYIENKTDVKNEFSGTIRWRSNWQDTRTIVPPFPAAFPKFLPGYTVALITDKEGSPIFTNVLFSDFFCTDHIFWFLLSSPERLCFWGASGASGDTFSVLRGLLSHCTSFINIRMGCSKRNSSNCLNVVLTNTNMNLEMCTLIQKLQVDLGVRFESLLCSPRQHLFDKKKNKNSSIVKHYYNLK